MSSKYTRKSFIRQLPHRVKKKGKEIKQLHNELEDTDDKKVNLLFAEAEENAFQEIDCLDCAHCCKTTGPLFTDRDIDRISQHLGMSGGKFVQKYLRIDEDGDYVLKSLPCPFLGKENKCTIYEIRPEACSSFPHTSERNQKKLLKMHRKNATICPAMFHIYEELLSIDIDE